MHVASKQYAILKSQFDGAAARVHTDAALNSRFLCAFIASILRTEVVLACQQLKLATNRMFLKLNQAKIVMQPNHQYRFIHNLSDKNKSLLKRFGINPEHFDAFADELNLKAGGKLGSQFHKIPGQSVKPAAVHNAEDAPTQEQPKCCRGRPKGSKNKKTITRMAGEQAAPSTEKRKLRAP